MKVIKFICSDNNLKTVPDSQGGSLEITKALKFMLGSVVNQAPYTLENSRLWTKIGNKIDASDIEIELEDAEYDKLKELYNAGVTKAFTTMAQRFWADELNRIINESN